jgi:hypothetical protein
LSILERAGVVGVAEQLAPSIGTLLSGVN